MRAEPNAKSRAKTVVTTTANRPKRAASGSLTTTRATSDPRRWPALYAYYRERLTVGRLAGNASGDNVRLAHWLAPSGRGVMLPPTKGRAHRDGFRATMEAPA